MARDYKIFGGSLVSVRLPEHIANQNNRGDGRLFEYRSPGVFPGGIGRPVRNAPLGVCSESSPVLTRTYHEGIKSDRQGSIMNAEVYTQGGEVDLTINLIHYDENVVDVCHECSQGGRAVQSGSLDFVVQRPGIMISKGLELYASGNNMLGLMFLSDRSGVSPWYFPACYLSEQPRTLDLGTAPSVLQMHWKAISYAPERYITRPAFTTATTLDLYYPEVDVTDRPYPLWTRDFSSGMVSGIF